jgi:hypothetical protein
MVKTLSSNKSGLTRHEIIEKAGLSSGGTITALLEELIESGFVTVWQPYDKKSRDTIYKLADEFTHFYFKFMERKQSSSDGGWLNLSSTQSWKSWSGVAFERVCLKHIPQIKKELGITGLNTLDATWQYQPKTGKGAQIDMLFDRQDFVINLFEMKFSESEFIIAKDYASDLERKRDVFKEKTKTKKSLYLTFITTFGVKDNEYAKRLVQKSIITDCLFT